MEKKKKVWATHVTGPGGKRIYIRGKDKADLQKKVAQARLAFGVGVNLADTTLFSEYAEMWLNVYKKPKVRENTYAAIEYLVSAKIVPELGEMRLRDIKSAHIQKFLSSLVGLSQGYQTRIISILRNIFATAVDNDIILKSPMRSTDKANGKAREEVEALTSKQCVELLAFAKQDDQMIYRFCFLILSTGLRRSEAIGLMWQDVDFQRGVINVCRSKAFVGSEPDAEVTTELKSKSAYRTIPISDALMRELKMWRISTQSDFVLQGKNGGSMNRNDLGRIKDHTRRAHQKGILDFHFKAHALRHTFITNLFDAGCDVKEAQYLAGHATPDMTLRIYTHYRESQRADSTKEKLLKAVNFLGES